MALESDGDATAKRPRQREDEESDQRDAAVRVDYLSALPEALQLRILARLPLKSAIRTAALSRDWRGLWERRWQDDQNPSSLHHHLLPYADPSPKKLLESLERRQGQGRRLDHFSLVVETSAMSARRFRRYLDAAARCAVEDLRVELRPPSSDKLCFHFPASSPILARLSLRGIRVSGLHCRGAQARPYSALEVVCLHSVDIDDRGLTRMLALCPRLRVLGLHFCKGLRGITMTAAMGLNLRSVTITGCSGVIEVDVAPISSLRSFRYSGGFLSSFYLPGRRLLCRPLHLFRRRRSRNVLICQKVFREWFDNLVCSKLTALTICSNVLFVVSSLPNAIAHAESAKMGDFFQSMTELQLLMLEMKAPDLANIYVFLKNSQCSNLDRLFVQLPSIPSEPLVDSFDYVGVEPPRMT